MQNSGTPAPSREQRTPAGIGNTLIAALPVLACFLGGGTAKWAEGFVLVFLGLLLLFDPPKHSLGPWLNAVVLALLGLAAVAFLPAHWFYQPGWRTALVNDFGIALPDRLSPQPWITLECLLSFFAGLSWFYYMTAREFEMRDVRQQARVFATGIVLLALVSIALYVRHLAPPLWHNERGFGPFPNRNQTGDLFGITAIMLLAAGQDDFRRGRIRWILSALGYLALGAALILDFSRAGILILVGGSILWLCVMMFRKVTPARLAIGLSLTLGLLTALLIFGGSTLERFHLRPTGDSGGISTDFRWAIFRDAWRLIRSSPWCGIGLGNFEPVFAISRVASIADTRSLHPESDWLWIWSELGWPGVALILLGAAFVIWHVFPLKEGTNQRFRLAALIAALFFGLHGLIDVSAHRIGTAFAGIFLFGLCVHRPTQFPISRVIPFITRFVGLALCTVGLVWVLATRNHWSLPGNLGADNLRTAALIENRSRNFEEAIADTTEALAWAPLDWRLYYTRALSKVGAAKPVTSAIDDFRRARFLEPNGYEVPFSEGTFWLTRRPILALTAWREALRRAGKRRAEIYGLMFFNIPKATEPFLESMAELAENRPALILAALERIAMERFPVALHIFLRQNPGLRGFTPEEQRRLFALWAERGDLDELARAVEAHPTWRAAAWWGLAKYNAEKQDYRAAVEIVRQFAPQPALPATGPNPSLAQLQQRFSAAPNDYGVGVALWREQMRQGKTDDALNTARHFSEMPDAPVYFQFLEFQSWATKGNWERAWNAWSAYARTGSRD